ncbi:MAG: 2-oxoacid:acceptor oxidoreductase family protein, partial [Betaproteobacteria bacterium]|nr:2-oxoacid:acceptor oxidoreductase family protein [Betaproteobacteria bacterium]
CVKGFCPSFVTVEGGQLKKGKAGMAKTVDDFPALPEPASASIDQAYGVLVTGIGGTGVVTIGQILAMAAHIEGKGVTVLDMSGLAQKGGPVMSHVRIANRPEDLHAARIATGDASLVIGCDLVVAANPDALAKMSAPKTRAVINATTAPTADFVRNPDWQLPGSNLQHDIAEACGKSNVDFVSAGSISTNLMGDSIATNMFMLGYAWQKGWVPVSGAALQKAIELNGVAVEFNLQSFVWGRRAAVDLARVEKIATPAEVIPLSQHLSRNLDELVARRAEFLTAYQDAAYAARYRELVDKVRRVESEKAGGTKLGEAVARYYAKLMAYKDEYEVARLHSNSTFMQKIEGMFEGDYKVVFHLAPPLLNKPDPATGEAKKSTFGPWMLQAFKLLAKFKGLRGTAFDLFGRSEERRSERALIAEYAATVEQLLTRLSPANHALAVDIASVPELIRGYGHVKMRHLKQAQKQRADLLAEFDAPVEQTARAA